MNSKESRTKCVFFDRDGIVNEPPDPARYVLDWPAFHLIPAFVECVRTVQGCGYEAAIVTNQRCVSLGLIRAVDLEALHRKLIRLLKREYGLRLLDIACCPHDVGQCSCRKPEPGMLLQLAARHKLDLGRSWMVGDSETDVEAGRRAGCRTIRVGALSGPSRADFRVATVQDLPGRLAELLKR